MKTEYKLYFTNVQLLNNYTEKNYTFISEKPIPDNKITQSFTAFELLGFTTRINSPNQYSIDSVKESVFCNLCKDLFINNVYAKYEGLLPFDSSINAFSFKKEVLLANNVYEPKEEVEFFLVKYNILKSYYYHKVNFTIKSINCEYSREYGERSFTTQYQSTKINSDIIKGEFGKYHSGDVYSSKAKQYIVTIEGVNDSGQKINIKLPVPSDEKKKNNIDYYED